MKIREAHDWRELHGALHVDHVGLHALAREVVGGDPRELGRDAGHAARRGAAREARDHHAAHAHLEVERAIEVRGALEEHVAAADAEVRRAVLHVRGHVVGLQQEEAQARGGRLAHEGAVVGEQRLDVDAGPREERRDGLEHAALGERDGEGLAHASAPFTRSIFAPRPRSFSSMRSYPRSM